MATCVTTKANFMQAYRQHVADRYGWAADVGRLDGLLASVRVTLFTERTTWVWDGEGSKAAWRAIGGKGKMTLKALRALPAE
jgi:hypothetical protein